MAQAQTADDVWRLLGELPEAQKRNRVSYQGTKRSIAASKKHINMSILR